MHGLNSCMPIVLSLKNIYNFLPTWISVYSFQSLYLAKKHNRKWWYIFYSGENDFEAIQKHN